MSKGKMTEEQLRAIVVAEKSSALSAYGTDDLSSQRSRAMDYYLSDMSADMPAMQGRSAAVSSDVADTIETILPSLMEIFAAGGEVVKFNPVGEDDVEAAAQETDYVNHVFWQDNPGFLILYTMIKDALLQKTGITKSYWEKTRKVTREDYTGQDEATFELISRQDGVTVVEHTQYPAPPPALTSAAPGDAGGAAPSLGGAAPAPPAMPGMPPPPVMMPALPPPPPALLHDFTITRMAKGGRAAVVNIPPEEFLIAQRARLLAGSPYCAHRTRKTESDLLEAGYDEDIVKGLPTSQGIVDETQEAVSRAAGSIAVNGIGQQLGSTVDSGGAGDANSSMRLIDVVEHYLMVDYDGDGYAELRQVTTGGGGDVILDNELVSGGMPFAVMSPILLPHRVIGLSIADLVIEIQKIKTALYRSVLDNAYLINSQRVEIAETHAGDNTIDDLLTNRPGGIIRTRAPGGLQVLQTQPIGAGIFPLLEYVDTAKQQRTGVSNNFEGLDPGALQRVAAGAAQLVHTATQQRVRLIARIFAETGIRDMFLCLHRLTMAHGREEKARVLELRGKWVTIDPSDWRERSDMTVSVGLGTGDKAQNLTGLNAILAIQKGTIEMQGGTDGPLVTLPKVHKTLTEIVKNAGFVNADDFFADPTPAPGSPPPAPKPPPPDPKMAEVTGKLEIEKQRAADASAAAQAKAQADAEHQTMQANQNHLREQEKQQGELRLAEQQQIHDREIAAIKVQAEAAASIERERIKGLTAIMVARINAGVVANDELAMATVAELTSREPGEAPIAPLTPPALTEGAA